MTSAINQHQQPIPEHQAPPPASAREYCRLSDKATTIIFFVGVILAAAANLCFVIPSIGVTVVTASMKLVGILMMLFGWATSNCCIRRNWSPTIH